MYHVDRKGKPVQLVYETPKEIKNLSRITMDIDSADCKTLWDRSVILQDVHVNACNQIKSSIYKQKIIKPTVQINLTLYISNFIIQYTYGRRGGL